MKKGQEFFKSNLKKKKTVLHLMHGGLGEGGSNRAIWNKVWVKPQGSVVKVFLREVSKDSQTVP